MRRIDFSHGLSITGGGSAAFDCLFCGVAVIGYGASIASALTGNVGVAWLIGHVTASSGAAAGCAACIHEIVC